MRKVQPRDALRVEQRRVRRDVLGHVVVEEGVDDDRERGEHDRVQKVIEDRREQQRD